MKKILLTAAFAVAVASPAFAASNHSRNSTANADQAYASAQNTEVEGQGQYAIDRATVVSGDEVLGRDPDLFIRQQLLRVGNTNELGSN
jgi:opacity protein-like surface antigen